ncbi:MAG: ATP-dependent helicase [Candidatus Diapherotrites archaeon]|nr:ATP-dependent helicase [Candidatus Diapherotrites archaeon]
MPIEFQKEKYSDEQIFASMHPLLRDWFKETFGKFTEPQRYAILNIHSMQNTLITAPTGTGKTLAAFAAILNELITLSEIGRLEDKVYCIYISPLRALSNDIERNLNEPLQAIKEKAEKLGKKINIRVAVRTGDTPTSKRASMLKKPPHILITTPESIAILLNAPRFKEHLKEAKWLIVDEIHALAENKRGVHLSLSMERLQRLNPELCRIGLSATIAPIKEIAKFLVGLKNEKEFRDCKIVDVQFAKGLDIVVLSPIRDMINVTQEEIQERLYTKLDELIQQHKTTLVFTNTRSATERVVNHLKDRFPGRYEGIIGAHHSSVSREKRLSIEERLKKGKLKAVVCSTSLELGIDIGYIDLVVLLGSPKSISRALQRIGRSGHRLHDTIKGRILVLDRDDLVECTILTKCAKEKKLDRIHIPTNCLDVLAQHIYGIAIAERIHERELFQLVRRSYCYKDLPKKDFNEVLSYLAGEYSSLETRHVYGKIWYDRETGYIGRRGKFARVIYMTNIGTIPDEAKVKVKIGKETIGYLDEAFLERLRKGDVFTLGGEKYRFLYSRGMTIQVKPAEKIPPTIPNWVSEMLPLSFDLACEIQRFRKLLAEKFQLGKKKEEIIEFIQEYAYCNRFTAETIYNYFYQQHRYAKIPHDGLLLVEQIKDAEGNHVVFHTLYGRRVNDALSRALAWVMSKLTSADIMVSINDNGFILTSQRKMPVENALSILQKSEIEIVLKQALEDSEILKRRFRHCATRALMILRQYKGYEKSVAKQQRSSSLLINAVKRIDPDFCILREARREVMEDSMDLKNARKVIEWLREGKIKVEKIQLPFPSPFAFNIFAMGRSDLIRIDNRLNFIKRMHAKVLEKIGGKGE